MGSGSHREGAIATLAAGAWRGGRDQIPIWSQYCLLSHPQVGRVVVTLEQPCSEENFVAKLCWQGAVPQGPTNIQWALEHTSDTVKTFRFSNIETTDPPDFSFEFRKGAH